MSVGKHYVLYVQPQYDRYEVNNCGNSHQTDETAVLKSSLEKATDPLFSLALQERASRMRDAPFLSLFYLERRRTLSLFL